LGFKAKKIFLPLQPGDVKETWADVSDLIEDLGYTPRTDIRKGIKEFISWYKYYYAIR
jgi:UDP-glucuronate 4-epimerase